MADPQTQEGFTAEQLGAAIRQKYANSPNLKGHSDADIGNAWVKKYPNYGKYMKPSAAAPAPAPTTAPAAPQPKASTGVSGSWTPDKPEGDYHKAFRGWNEGIMNSVGLSSADIPADPDHMSKVSKFAAVGKKAAENFITTHAQSFAKYGPFAGPVETAEAIWTLGKGLGKGAWEIYGPGHDVYSQGHGLGLFMGSL